MSATAKIQEGTRLETISLTNNCGSITEVIWCGHSISVMGINEMMIPNGEETSLHTNNSWVAIKKITETIISWLVADCATGRHEINLDGFWQKRYGEEPDILLDQWSDLQDKETLPSELKSYLASTECVESLNEKDIEQIVDELKVEIEQEIPKGIEPEWIGRALRATGLQLAKNLGKDYVLETLPIKIYAKICNKLPAVSKYVSQEKWLKIWLIIIGLSIGDIHAKVKKELEQYVWPWIAWSCASIVVALIVALL